MGHGKADVAINLGENLKFTLFAGRQHEDAAKNPLYTIKYICILMSVSLF